MVLPVLLPWLEGHVQRFLMPGWGNASETVVDVLQVKVKEQEEPFLKGRLAITPLIFYVFKYNRPNLLLLEVFHY